jgi:hypothetical protein
MYALCELFAAEPGDPATKSAGSRRNPCDEIGRIAAKPRER